MGNNPPLIIIGQRRGNSAGLQFDAPRWNCHLAGRIFGSMTTVTCQCGAIYQRLEEKGVFRVDKSSFNCYVCGKELESWSGARVIIFKLLKRPETDTD